MDEKQHQGSELAALARAILRGENVRASNTGSCMEDGDSGIKLHLGCGRLRWDGWTNVDLHSEVADVRCDLRRLDAFKDGSADVACAVHVLEHFHEWEAMKLLLEWKRVLKPGGKLVLELPCLDKVLQYIREAVEKREPMVGSFSWYVFWGDPRYKSEPMCHKWGYTIGALQQALEGAGFERVTFERPRYHFPARDMRATAYKPC